MLLMLIRGLLFPLHLISAFKAERSIWDLTGFSDTTLKLLIIFVSQSVASTDTLNCGVPLGSDLGALSFEIFYATTWPNTALSSFLWVVKYSKG